MSADNELHVRPGRGPYPDTLGSLSVPLILRTAQTLDGKALGNVSPAATAIYALLDECTRRDKWVNPEDTNSATFTLRENTNTETTIRARAIPDFSVDESYQLAVLLLAECVTMGGIASKAFEDEGHAPGWYVMALEYDFFGPGYTAYQPISQEDVRVLYRFHQRDTDQGRDAWLVYWHRRAPCATVLSRIETGGKWSVQELARGILPEDLRRELDVTKKSQAGEVVR